MGLDIIRIDLVDPLGKAVYSSGDIKSQTVQVDLDGIASGIYAARVYTEKGVASKKVVLQ